MNTTKHYKQIRNIFIANVVLSLFWLYWTFGRTYATFANGYIQPESPAILYSIVIGYCLTAVLLIITQSSFLWTQKKIN